MNKINSPKKDTKKDVKNNAPRHRADQKPEKKFDKRFAKKIEKSERAPREKAEVKEGEKKAARGINESRFFASCPQFMEELLQQELQELGIADTYIAKGGVSFSTTPFRALRVVLYSRLASRVFKEITNLNFMDEKEIYPSARQFFWEKVMRVDNTFKISTLLDSKASFSFKNSQYLSLVLKDAIVDHFKDLNGMRPNVDLEAPHITFMMRVEGRGRKDLPWKGIVYIDLTGVALSNRGYRQKGHEAPLRENVAAALVKQSGWDPSTQSFTDPMCGTGTILIEAALIAGNIPPSYLKVINAIENNRGVYPFQRQTWYQRDQKLREMFDKELRKIYDNLDEQLDSIPLHRIYGADNDRRTLSLTKKNLSAAKLDGIVTLFEADVTTVRPFSDLTGVILTNPPYGERLGTEEELKELYYNIGENLKQNFTGFTAFLLTSNGELRKKVSLHPNAKIPVMNGNLECRLLRYNLY